MCNIPMMDCAVCGTEIEMHLEDFATEPEEVRVYCPKDIPTGLRGILWLGGDHGKVFVESLTDNAFAHRDGNGPNDDSRPAPVAAEEEN